MDFDDLKELGGGILAIVVLFIVLGAVISLAMKLDDDMPTSENKHVPLDSGVIYEKYEIPRIEKHLKITMAICSTMMPMSSATRKRLMAN